MPRYIPDSIAANLTGDSLNLCVGCRITRTDGTVLGFNTSDQYITDHEGGATISPGEPVIYKPINSVSSTSVKATSTTGVDNMEIMGIIDSDDITEIDIRLGLYDNAEVVIFLMDPTANPIGSVPGPGFHPDYADKICILRGTVGTITLVDGKYTFEVRSTSQFFKQQFGAVTTPTCRAVFGDAGCAPGGHLATGNTLAGNYTYGATVGAVQSEFTFHATLGSSWPTDLTETYFAEGNITFTSGQNTGVLREVKSHTPSGSGAERIFSLHRPFPYPVAPADTLNIVAGCQKRFREDCIAKFSNALNFVGEPEIPGNDTLIQVGRPAT